MLPQYPHFPFQNLDKLCHQFFRHPDVFNVLAERVINVTRYSTGHLGAISADGKIYPVTPPAKGALQELDKTVHLLLREASTTLPDVVQEQAGESRSVAIMFRDASLVLHTNSHPACPDFWWFVSDQDALVARGKLITENVLPHFDGRDFPLMKGLTHQLKVHPS